MKRDRDESGSSPAWNGGKPGPKHSSSQIMASPSALPAGVSLAHAGYTRSAG